jgi:hypothetical protein
MWFLMCSKKLEEYNDIFLFYNQIWLNGFNTTFSTSSNRWLPLVIKRSPKKHYYVGLGKKCSKQHIDKKYYLLKR